jgi:uncharacterized protein YjaZ
VNVLLELVDANFDSENGVSGRAQAPGEIVAQVSNQFVGGAFAAIEAGLECHLYHELHHLYKGWTVEKNKYGPEIYVKAVIEGLAIVFTEQTCGSALDFYIQDKDEVLEVWLKEVMALPKDASYTHWMYKHPDGRQGIAYRVGRYVIYKAMAKSKLDIVELSKLTPEQILENID